MACLHFDDNNNALTNSHHRQPIFGHRNSISDHGDKQTRVRRSENTSEKCIPGTRWKQDCNSCWCTEAGFGACTLMGCLHFDISNQQTLRKKRSSSDTASTTMSPTRQRKTSSSANEKKCEQGTTWMNDCNRCRCTRGGHAACTRMMCIEKETII